MNPKPGLIMSVVDVHVLQAKQLYDLAESHKLLMIDDRIDR